MITLRRARFEVLRASARLRKRPVDSITTSTPSSPHGSSAGSLFVGVAISLPSTTMPSSTASTVPSKRSVDRVVLEQVGEHRRIGDVVDRDPLDVCA